MSRINTRRRAGTIVVGTAVVAGALAGCSGAAGDGRVEITYSTGAGEETDRVVLEQIEAFEQENPDIKVSLVTRPVGGEGDNLVKTQLATGEMDDVFRYQVGSLMQALNPEQTLTDLSDQPWTGDVLEDFRTSASAAGQLFAAPIGTTYGAGVLYNIPLYEELGLEIPVSWADFMANNEKIQEAKPDVAPVIQAFGTTWTSQIFVLGSFASVDKEDPEWAADYTENKVRYSEEPAIQGFAHQQDVYEAGMLNEDYPSLSVDGGLAAVATGTGAHYPLMTHMAASIRQNNPENLNDVGFFALPADDPQFTAATIWQPDGLYIPKTTEGAQLEAAKKWIDWLTTSDKACEISQANDIAGGPYAYTGCVLTGEVPRMVQDLSAYIEAGDTAPALEFLSPIKGPNLENIAIEVGSGIRSAVDGAKVYDEDVKKQAQQLGLPGW